MPDYMKVTLVNFIDRDDDLRINNIDIVLNITNLIYAKLIKYIFTE